MRRKEEWHIPQIKRRGEDGLIIAYLSSKESLLSASLTEHTMTALRHNWYPFALRYGGVRTPRLKEVAMWCSHQLRAQADLIDATFGIPPRQMPYFPYPAGVPVAPTVDENKEENVESEENLESVDMDLGEDFDMTQSLLTQLS